MSLRRRAFFILVRKPGVNYTLSDVSSYIWGCLKKNGGGGSPRAQRHMHSIGLAWKTVLKPMTELLTPWGSPRFVWRLENLLRPERSEKWLCDDVDVLSKISEVASLGTLACFSYHPPEQAERLLKGHSSKTPSWRPFFVLFSSSIRPPERPWRQIVQATAVTFIVWNADLLIYKNNTRSFFVCVFFFFCFSEGWGGGEDERVSFNQFLFVCLFELLWLVFSCCWC